MPTEHNAVQMSMKQYLALENSNEIKHEFVGGYIGTAAPSSQAHNLIALAQAIKTRLKCCDLKLVV